MPVCQPVCALQQARLEVINQPQPVHYTVSDSPTMLPLLLMASLAVAPTKGQIIGGPGISKL